jgi:esterase/lipase
MGFDLIIELAILAIAIIQFIVIIILLSKNRQGSQEYILQKLVEYDQRLDKSESNIRSDLNKTAKDSREELLTTITNFTGLIDNKKEAARGLRLP